jgi:nucleotide-binding universal stress UspA family protein
MQKTILVPIQDITQSEKAIQQVAVISRAFEAGVHLLGLIQSGSTTGAHQFADPVSWDATRKQKQAALGEIAGKLEAQQIPTGLEMLDMFTLDLFVRYVEDGDFKLIILSEEYQTNRALTRDVLAHTSVPMFIVRSQLPTQFRRILIPLDGSQRAECILPSVTTLAQSMEATLILTHIIQEPEMPRRTSPNAEDIKLAEQLIKRNQQESERYLYDLSERLPVPTETNMVVGSSITTALHEQIKQQDVDLVGLCAHGFSGKPEWPFGSITSNLIDYCPTSLMILQDLPNDLPAVEAEASGRHSGGR